MNWQTVFNSMQSLSRGSPDAPMAITALRDEVETTTQLTAADKDEITLVLDKLQLANMYGKIALMGQLKNVLSKHAGFTKLYAEYSINRLTNN
jgi:hypothetical protein